MLLASCLQQSTFDFKLLSGDTPTQRIAPVADSTNEDTYYDSEYVLGMGLSRGGVASI